MTPHIRAKLFALGAVLAALITAFSAPARTVKLDVSDTIIVNVAPARDIRLTPTLTLLSEPREVTRSLPHGPDVLPRYTLRATGYNSVPEQTYGDPFITSTGERTRFGIIAVSRELLGKDIPYGSLVRIRDMGVYGSNARRGLHQRMLDEQNLFIVEDTLHFRKRQQIDIWFPTLSQAVQWGVREVELEIVRYGRSGPMLDISNVQPLLEVTPQLSARAAP